MLKLPMTDENSNITLGNGARSNDVFNNGGIAIGNFTFANGQNSIAIGSSNGNIDTTTTANGNYSIAIGAGLVTNSNNALGDIKIGNSKFNSSYYDGGCGWRVNADDRDKINTSLIENSLNFISQIDPIRFQYNYRKNYSDTSFLIDCNEEEYQSHKLSKKSFDYGVNAQQVGEVLKNVYGSEYYGNIISKRTESLFEGERDEYYMDLVNFIPFLIGAIKEQQIQIDELKKRLGENNG